MTPIRVTKEGVRWIARFSFDWQTKDHVKAAGFQFDPTTKYWFTTDATVAAQLDPRAAAQANQAIAASRATNVAVDIPVPAGLEYLPYQKAGIAYALGRPNTLVGDEMGLGKTIQAIGVINADPSIKSVLVVCPASIKINWARELTKWLMRPLSIGIVNGEFPRTDVVIVNYDVLAKFRPQIDARQWDMLCADEVHFAKNPKAQRTQALLGNRKAGKPGIKARRRLFLSGTPIVNRPIELFPLVEALDPDGLGRSFFQFAKRYTMATHNGFGWDFSGAANLEELQQRLRAKFMVRRLKSEVLKELPPKRRQVVVVPVPAAAAAAVANERAVFEEHRKTIERANTAADAAKARGDKDGYQAAIKALHSANKIAFEKMSLVRHATAIAKIPALIEHITEILEAEPKVVVFCHHLDVVAALREAFPDAALVTGAEPSMAKRQAEVDRFQHDPECRVFVGTYPGAAGVGWTLTAAQTVVFGELDFVPGNVSQAEDRLHRIGQLGSVLVQHLVFDSSVDTYMAQMIIDKQEVITATLDQRALPVTSAAPQEPPEDLFAPRPEPAAANGGDSRIPFDSEVPF